MVHTKYTLRQTLQLIADILSFETSNTHLEHLLCNKTVNWDALVIVASNHLVLPAVYCRLKQRSLLYCLPEDLTLYLDELTELNRNRNGTLLEDARTISKLLAENRINFVFLKGIAILAGDYYKDHGERMIGDIDILVALEDLDKAFELLKREGYTHTLEFNYDVRNYRHLPRQISDIRIGAIEIHGQLLKHGYNHLIDTEAILTDKKIINGLPIPNSKHLIVNAILAQQINDRATYYNTLHFKVIYDVLVLKLNHKVEVIRELSQETHNLQFLKLASIFFQEIRPSKESVYTRFKTSSFLFQLDHPKLRHALLKSKQIFMKLSERLGLILFNKSYRKHVLKNKILKQKM